MSKQLRIRSITVLCRVFFVFFVRKVMAFGVLRKPAARWSLLALIVFNLVVMTVLIYLFFQELNLDQRGMLMLVNASSLNILFWTTIAFVISKILFAKSGGLLNFTYQLPVSNRERTMAIITYETLMVLAAVLLAVFPFTVSLLFIAGWETVLPLISGVLLPILILYPLLTLFHNLLMALFALLGLARFALSASLTVLVLPLMLVSAFSIGIAKHMFEPYLRGGVANFVGFNLFPYLLQVSGFWVVLLVFLSLFALLAPLALWSSPTRHPPVKQYVMIPVVFMRGVWLMAAAFIRRAEWWSAVFITYLLAIMLFASGGEGFMLTALLLLSQGLYAFSATEPLRRLPGYKKSAVLEVAHLLLAELLVTAVFAVPIFLLALFRPEAFSAAPMLLLLLLTGTGLTIMVGIVFVPEDDNPLAALLGYSAVLAALFALAAVISLLRPGGLLIWLLSIVLDLFCVAYSVFALKQLRNRRRYASI